MRTAFIALITTAVIGASAAWAQAPGSSTGAGIDAREANQQRRIGNGIKSGKLNSQQASNLEKRETSVQNREKKDMSQHNGHLTKAEQKGINRQQNRISKSIYKDKH